MIRFTVTRSGNDTKAYFDRLQKIDFRGVLDKYGSIGVQALSAGTPVESGLTAASWYYEVTGGNGSYTISWYNSHEVNGVNIAVILQYGHGTGTGGYVRGRDYINPAMRPLFDQMAADLWRVVSSA